MPPTTPSPWWSGTPRQVWDTPAPRPRPASTAPAPALSRGRRRPQDTVHDVWATTDTLGQEPRPAGSRTGLLVALAAAIALVAGVAGGGAGYLLAERDDGTSTVDGASLGAAPARRVDRPEGSIPGVAARCCRASCRSRSTPRRVRPPGPASSSTTPGVHRHQQPRRRRRAGRRRRVVQRRPLDGGRGPGEVRELRHRGAPGGREEPARAAAGQLRQRRRRRPGAGHRLPAGSVGHRHQRHRQRARTGRSPPAASRGRATARTSTPSRPMPPSTRATRAARWSTSTAR